MVITQVLMADGFNYFNTFRFVSRKLLKDNVLSGVYTAISICRLSIKVGQDK